MIEENRRKAIAKRQSKTTQSSSNQNIAGPSVNPTNNSTAPSSFYSSTPTSKKLPPKGNTPEISSRFSKSLNAGGRTPNSSASKSSFSALRSIVSFELVSRHQFLVDSPFNSQMIEIFKRIPSRTYDAVKRKWLFAVKDHKMLLENLDPLLSTFEVHPLPNYVIQMFRYSKLLPLFNKKINSFLRAGTHLPRETFPRQT